MGAEAHINACYKHFFYFSKYFNLVDKRELEPLVIMSLCFTCLIIQLTGQMAQVVRANCHRCNLDVWALAQSRGDGHRSFVTPERALSEYNEDLI